MSVVEQIFIAPASGAPQQALESVRAVAGCGLEGDRHFAAQDYRGQQLTLIEAEVLEAFLAEDGRPLGFAFSRRNLVTRGVSLNALVGRRFRVGEVLFYGVETCEPCATLGRQLASERLGVAEAVRRFVGCGGLRAEILASGWIRCGDPLLPVD
jgi:MOSC domain-containing protein YiiM